MSLFIKQIERGEGQSRHDYTKNGADYITQPENMDTGDEKCVLQHGFNLSGEAFDGEKLNVAAAVKEIVSHVNGIYPEENPKPKNVLSHWVISVKEDRPGEPIPTTPEEMKAIAIEFLHGMGIDPEKHHVMLGVHTDTDNLHAHLYISQVSLDGELVRMGMPTKDGKTDGKTFMRAQKTICEISHRRGLEQFKKNRFEMPEGSGPDTEAVPKKFMPKKPKLDALSQKAAAWEKHHPGEKSAEGKAKNAAKLVMAGLIPGMGLADVKAAFAAQNLTWEESKGGRGIVWTLTDGETTFRMKGSDLITIRELSPFIQSATPPTTATTAATFAADIATIKQNVLKAENWAGMHRALAAHGITVERIGGSSKNGGELRYSLADGTTISGADVQGASLSEMEKALDGSTFRQPRKRQQAEISALVSEAKGEKPAATITEAVKESVTAQAEKTAQAYASGLDLKQKYEAEEREYLESARVAKDIATRIKKQGYNREAVEAALKKAFKNFGGSSFPTPEKMAIASISVLVKMLLSMRDDAPGLGAKAVDVAKKINSALAYWQKEQAALKDQTDIAERVTPPQRRAIYEALKADVTKTGQASPFLISGGIATRLRIAGHTQTSIVEILKAGGETPHQAELSGFYAFGEKGDAKYEEYKGDKYKYERLVHNARLSASNTTGNKAKTAADDAALRTTQQKEVRKNRENAEHQSRNNAQNTQKHKKSHGLKMG